MSSRHRSALLDALGRTLAIARKEVLHLKRDPRSLYLALGVPVMLLVLFGYGVSFDADHLPLAILDQDGSEASRRLQRELEASGEFERTNPAGSSAEEIHLLFESREALAVLIIPEGFASRVRRGRDADLQLLVDGVEANLATQVIAKADTLIRNSLGSTSLGVVPPPYQLSTSLWFNPSSRSALFLVPGLVAYVLALVCVLLTSLTIAREYERGSMQQLFVTPVKPLEVLLGKLLPYFVLGVLAALLVLASGTWIFDVPLRGDPWALVATGALFLAGMLAQGLVISVVAKNQMVATQIATMSSMLPSLILSGFLFPIENMPLPLQVLSNVVPARYFIHSLRGVMLRGNGFSELGTDLVALACFATLMTLIGLRRFTKGIA